MQKSPYMAIVLFISIGMSRANAEEVLPLDCIGPYPPRNKSHGLKWNKCTLSVDALKTQMLKVGIKTSLGCPVLSNVEIY